MTTASGNDFDDLLEPTEPTADELASPTRSVLMRTVSLQHAVCHLHKGQQRLERIVRGDNGEGLVVRVDRLEQSEGRHRWWARTGIGMVIALVVVVVGAVFKKVW